MDPESNLKDTARQIRILVLEMVYRAKASHVGTSFSCTDILTALYFGNVMRVNSEQPLWLDRDIFILSKGHGCTALYATLALKGFFSKEKLREFSMDGKYLSAHATFGSLPGIEATGGSGGHGPSIGAGMALAAKLDKRSSRVFVLTGDGECQEGSIWEAVMFAGQHNLSNLTLIVDNNRLQIMGRTRDIVNPEPLVDKFKAFNWEAFRVDGHDFEQLLNTLRIETRGPKAIVAQTIKGKGVSFMEGNHLWHGLHPNDEQYQSARKELENASSSD